MAVSLWVSIMAQSTTPQDATVVVPQPAPRVTNTAGLMEFLAATLAIHTQIRFVLIVFSYSTYKTADRPGALKSELQHTFLT
jgi:hypothetical protein